MVCPACGSHLIIDLNNMFNDFEHRDLMECSECQTVFTVGK